MLTAIPLPHQRTEIAAGGDELLRAATMARIAGLRHAARLLGATDLADGPAVATLQRRHALRAARETGAAIESALSTFADQIEAGRPVEPAAIDRVQHELERALASLDLLFSL